MGSWEPLKNQAGEQCDQEDDSGGRVERMDCGEAGLDAVNQVGYLDIWIKEAERMK